MSRTPHAYPMGTSDSGDHDHDADGSSDGTVPVPRSIRARVAPEAVASLLLVLVVAVASAVLVPGIAAGPGAEATPSDPPPSGAAVVTPVPSATVRPWMAAARTLLTADARLVTLREELATEVAAQPAQAASIARVVRSINQVLRAASDALDTAGSAGLPPAISARSNELHSTALALGTTVLDASVGNTGAYVNGGAELVAALGGLEESMAEVARASGLPPPAAGSAP